MAGPLENKILKWRLGRILRKSYPPDARLRLRLQTDRLISRLYSSGISPSATLERGLPTFTNAVSPVHDSLHLEKIKIDQLQMGLDLAIKAAECSIDPATMLQRGLVEAARSLDSFQFCAVIDFASRLIERKIDPLQALDYALPAAAKNSTAPAEFQANLEVIERLIVACNEQRHMHFLPELPALAKLDPDLFRGVIEAGVCLAENTFNPAPMFKSFQSIHSSLSKAKIWAALDLAMQLAQQKMQLRETLQQGIPALAKAAKQFEFNVGLECASQLVQMKIHPESMLRYGIPAALNARKSAAEFQLNLQALEQFVIAVDERHNDKCWRVLMSLSSLELSSEQFRLSLEFATHLTISEVDVSLFEAGVQAALQAATKPEEIHVNFGAMERISVRLAKQGHYRVAEILRAIPHAGLNSQQLCAGLETAARLEEQEVASSVLLKYGLQRLARASAAEDFATNLQTLEVFLVRSAKLRPITDDSFGDALRAALQGRTRLEIETGLEIFERLITRLHDQRVLGDIAGGLRALVKQAIALKQCYEDFEVVLHHAITREEEYTDSYYGYSSTTTHVDYPQWIELIPSGRRLTPIGLAMLDRGHIQRLLEDRSWAYRDEQSPSNRERAIERSVHWRSYLPVFIDQLMRQGILDPVTPVISAYLIGSYPWIADPNDLDLFIVVEGTRDASYFSAAELIRKGVAQPEFFVHPTTQSLLQRNTSIPPLRLGISVEVIGYETLLRASRGEAVRHAAVLARRYCLLFGSVLLAGEDLFQSNMPPAMLFRELHRDLLRDMKRADWPELAGDAIRIAAKKAWRKREADALSKLIATQFK